MVSQTLFTEVSLPATCTSAVALSWLYTAPSILAWLVTYSCINCIGDHAVIFCYNNIVQYTRTFNVPSSQASPVHPVWQLQTSGPVHSPFTQGGKHASVECEAYHSYPWYCNDKFIFNLHVSQLSPFQPISQLQWPGLSQSPFWQGGSQIAVRRGHIKWNSYLTVLIMHAQSSYVVGSLCHSIHLRIYTSGVVYIFLHFHTEDHTLHKQKRKQPF